MLPTFSTDESPLRRLRAATISSEELIALLNQYQILPQLIQELLIDQVIAPITVSSEEALIACKQFYQQQGITSEAELQTWLESKGISREQSDWQIIRHIRLQQFKRDTWGHKLESYFLQRKASLDQVIYSLLRVTDVGISQELYFRIREGEQTFGELASQYSQGPEGQTGGLIGPVELSTPHPILANILSTSQPGQLVPPTLVGDWVVIVRLEKFLPAQLDDAMRQRLMNELFEAWMREKMNSEL